MCRRNPSEAGVQLLHDDGAITTQVSTSRQSVTYVSTGDLLSARLATQLTFMRGRGRLLAHRHSRSGRREGGGVDVISMRAELFVVQWFHTSLCGVVCVEKNSPAGLRGMMTSI